MSELNRWRKNTGVTIFWITFFMFITLYLFRAIILSMKGL